jgi:GNAT superfamily N-acetyltransferase
VASWIAQPGNNLLLAVERGTILGVGSVTDAGEITLNYVSPDARFRGVSGALMGALEDRAMKRGNARCTLTSTETARSFYQTNGYVEDGPPAGKIRHAFLLPDVEASRSAKFLKRLNIPPLLKWLF